MQSIQGLKIEAFKLDSPESPAQESILPPL